MVGLRNTSYCNTNLKNMSSSSLGFSLSSQVGFSVPEETQLHPSTYQQGAVPQQLEGLIDACVIFPHGDAAKQLMEVNFFCFCFFFFMALNTRTNACMR